MKEKIGYMLLRSPRKNKGTAFNAEERRKSELAGLLPAKVETLETQMLRVNNRLSNAKKFFSFMECEDEKVQTNITYLLHKQLLIFHSR